MRIFVIGIFSSILVVNLKISKIVGRRWMFVFKFLPITLYNGADNESMDFKRVQPANGDGRD